MLDKGSAQKLVKELGRTTSYNINIINERGVIIASCDSERVGDFHELAHYMLKNKIPMMEVGDDSFLGTRPGINAAIELGGDVVGVVGITGEPGEVRPIILLLKAAVESMLEFEERERRKFSRSTMKDKFFGKLLYDNDTDEKQLAAQASALGYSPDMPRISILMTADERDLEALKDFCKQSDLHAKNDMLISNTGRYLLVFLHLERTSSIQSTYREQTEEYLSPIRFRMEREGRVFTAYIGSIQCRLTKYRAAYSHCVWLSKNIRAERAAYFYDHIFGYLHSKLPEDELSAIFDGFSDFETDEFWADYVKVMEAMNSSNNNMVAASAKLHMHKNTLVYQFNRIRSSLGIDPISSAADNSFARELLWYVGRKSSPGRI